MRLARMAYHLFKRGRLDRDFPEQVLLHSLNGTDVRNINHSNIFPTKFLPIVGEEVKLKLKSFFLPQDYLKLAAYQLEKLLLIKLLINTEPDSLYVLSHVCLIQIILFKLYFWK